MSVSIRSSNRPPNDIYIWFYSVIIKYHLRLKYYSCISSSHEKFFYDELNETSFASTKYLTLRDISKTNFPCSNVLPSQATIYAQINLFLANGNDSDTKSNGKLTTKLKISKVEMKFPTSTCIEEFVADLCSR